MDPFTIMTLLQTASGLLKAGQQRQQNFVNKVSQPSGTGFGGDVPQFGAGGNTAKPSFESFKKTVNPDFLGNDYDLESAYNNLDYNKMTAWAKDPMNNHLPDTYKLPNHSSFSNQSMYYKPGMPAVKWQGDNAVPDLTQATDALSVKKPSIYTIINNLKIK